MSVSLMENYYEFLNLLNGLFIILLYDFVRNLFELFYVYLRSF